PVALPTRDDREVGRAHEVELAAHAVLEERGVMAEVVREVSGHRANGVEQGALLEVLERVIPDEHGELDVGEGIPFPGRERAEHQRSDDALVCVARLTEALDHPLLKHCQSGFRWAATITHGMCGGRSRLVLSENASSCAQQCGRSAAPRSATTN